MLAQYRISGPDELSTVGKGGNDGDKAENVRGPAGIGRFQVAAVASRGARPLPSGHDAKTVRGNHLPISAARKTLTLPQAVFTLDLGSCLARI